VERAVPADQRCLGGERGYLLFDEHARPGHGVVLERRDAPGKVLWSKRLEDLYAPDVVGRFVDLGGARMWTWGWWFDPARDEVVVLARGGPLRRIAVADGAVLPAGDEEALLRARIATGRLPERRSALDAAKERRVSGLVPVLEAELASRAEGAEAWRVDVAAALLGLEDRAAAWDALLQSLAAGRPEATRRAAATALHRALAAATPARRTGVLERARTIDSAEARWLREQAGR
jgi:hypothetical protein